MAHDSLGLFDSMEMDMPDVPIMPSSRMIPGHLVVESSNDLPNLGPDMAEMPKGLFAPDLAERPKGLRVQKKRKPRKDEDVIEKTIDDLTPDFIKPLEDSINDVLEPVNKPFEGIEDDIERGVDTLAEDIFPEANKWSSEGYHNIF